MDTHKVPRYFPRPTPMSCATAAQMIDHLQCILLPGVGTTSLFLRKFLRNAEMKKEQRGQWAKQRIHRELQWDTVAKRAGGMQPSGQPGENFRPIKKKILLKIQPCFCNVEMDDDINHSLGLQGNCLDVHLPGCVPKETSICGLRLFALLLPPASRSAPQMAGGSNSCVGLYTSRTLRTCETALDILDHR